MMRNPRFRYVAPKTVSEAVKALADPESMPIAGGTDLIPKMKRRQFTPKLVVGLGGIDALRGTAGTPGKGMQLGAGLRLDEIARDPEIRSGYRVLARTMKLIGNPLIQNMGTLGGNLCLDTRCTYYDQNLGWRESIDYCLKKDGKTCWVAPSSPRCWAVSSTDSAPVMIALGAKVKLASSRGERLIDADALFNDDGIRWLNKERDELLTEVHLPAVNGWRASYRKLRRRGSIDFPVLGVAAWASFDGDRIRDARIVLSAVGSRPHSVDTSPLIGRTLTGETIAIVAEGAYARGKPLDNTDFMMTWRKRMIRQYVTAALEDLRRTG